MNTNPATTQTFAELMREATPGPFERRMNDLVSSVKDGFVCDCEKTDFAKRPAPSADKWEANAELIARLLNFAHAGGEQALEKMLSWSKTFAFTQAIAPSSDGPLASDIRDAQKALAILNGKTP